MESIDRIKLLINYDTRKTLTENVIFLNEDAYTKLARQGELVAKQLEGTLKAMKADAKLAEELKNLKPGGIQTADDLLIAITTNKLSANAKGFMNSQILKSGTVNEKLISASTEDLVKSPQFAQKYFSSWRDSAGRPGLEQALKDSGKYSERAITNIVSQTERNLVNIEKLSKTKLKGVKPVTQDAKKAEEIIKTKPEVINGFKKYSQKFKKIPWKNVVGWAIGLGVSAGVLWWIFKKLNIAPPVDIPPSPEPEPETKPFQWKQSPSCDDVNSGNATIKSGMRGECVTKIQTQLKTKGFDEVGNPDGKFGKNTKSAVTRLQRNGRLNQTGVVDSATYKLLFFDSATTDIEKLEPLKTNQIPTNTVNPEITTKPQELPSLASSPGMAAELQRTTDDGTYLPKGTEGPINQPDYESENPQVTNQQTGKVNTGSLNQNQMNKINRRANRKQR